MSLICVGIFAWGGKTYSLGVLFVSDHLQLMWKTQMFSPANPNDLKMIFQQICKLGGRSEVNPHDLESATISVIAPRRSRLR